MVCGNLPLFAHIFNVEQGSVFTNRVSRLTQNFLFILRGAMSVTPFCWRKANGTTALKVLQRSWQFAKVAWK